MMDKDHWLPPIRCMHEWPLVLFTALAVPAAGIYVVAVLAASWGLVLRMPGFVRGIGAGMLALGVSFSFLHLGRPRRAPLALGRIGRNTLSTEVAFASVLVLLAFALVAPSWSPLTDGMLRFLAGVAAVALLATLGLVYFLRAHSPWRSALVASPLVSGVAAGAVILGAVPGNDAIRPVALALLAVDALLCLVAWRRSRKSRGLAAHPAIDDYRRRLLLLRLIFANALPAGLIAAGLVAGAAIAACMGVLLDRFSFYGLAVVETTEAAVAAVERRIRGE